jgi:integrase
MQGGFARKRGTKWTAYYYSMESGRRVQHTKAGFATKREAQAFLATVLGAVQSGAYIAPIKLTVEEYLLDRWLPTMEASLRPSTFDSYGRVLRMHVLPTLGHIALQNLTADHLDRLYRGLLANGRADGKSGGLSPKSVRYIHTTLHKALRDAERKRLINRNVASTADPPKLRPVGEREMKTWTASELRTFLDVMKDHHLGAAYHLAATTGMRRGEVLGVRWQDIDFTAKRLAVRQTVISVNYQVMIGQPKTAKGRRVIALDAGTVAVLRAHQQHQKDQMALIGSGYRDGDLVFAKPDGQPLNPDYFSQVFDRSVIKFGLPKIRLHDLRHTHATLGQMSDVAMDASFGMVRDDVAIRELGRSDLSLAG